MKKTIIPFTQVPQLAKSDIAYATRDPKLRPFFEHPTELAAFDTLIPERAQISYPRKDLVALLEKQYAQLPAKAKVQEHIKALEHGTTFCVTTGHQPSLFFGPLYFIYKALTTINLAESVQSNGNKVVPVFVLGSEDHDLEELNKVNLYGKTIVWEPGVSGAVGSIDAASLQDVLQQLKTILGDSPEASNLYSRVERAYSGQKNFAQATQALLHEFLGDFGLVVVNMNSPELKRHFIPLMRQELLEQPAFKLVNETISRLNAEGFKTQAAPREINLFYMKTGLRERIVLEDGVYKVLNTELVFSADAILQELETHPEHFSPNVVLRPVFQELILPNLAYIGGGGELAYWLERKSLFEFFKVPFPMLVRRHSVLWLDKDAVKKLEKFGFTPAAFFEDIDALVREYVEKNSAGEFSLATEIKELQEVYNKLTQKATTIDPTLEKAVRAEEVKAVSGLEQWENRLMRAEKQKHEVAINQIRSLKEKLFPANGLQERTDNILPYLLKYGDGFLTELKSIFEPFENGFVVAQES